MNFIHQEIFILSLPDHLLFYLLSYKLNFIVLYYIIFQFPQTIGLNMIQYYI